VRKAAVDATIEPVLALAHQLRHEGLDVPEIVCGGTGTFLYHAQHGDAITASPGTSVFWDWGYTQRFPELNERFTPAALVFGRVISRPGPGYVTLDIGNKAIAADPPVGSRGRILGLEDAKTMQHNEEHWSMSSATAGNFAVGDYALVIPAHICPCTNLHPWLHILNRQGEPAGRWEVAARQRAPLG
jgi:D-serine deaminase-like pyridoxal phosphate-dependent protein